MTSLIFKGFLMRTFLLFVFISTTLLAHNIGLKKAEQEWIKEHKNVLYTGDPNWLPFEAFDENGKYIGIVADHLALVEQKTGLKFLPQIVNSWTESLQMANEGKVSVISGDAADKTLNQNFRPIEPYLINPIIIIMDNHAHYVEDLNTLQDKKVAIIKDYGYTADLFKQYPKMKFIEVNNIQEGLKGVSHGDYDAMLASYALASYSIASMGLEDIKIVGKTSIIMEVTLFVDKDKPILFDIINKAIKSISNKEQQSISDKWTKSSSQAKAQELFILSIALFSTLALLVAVYIIRHFKKSKERYANALEGSNEGLWNWDIINNKMNFSPLTMSILKAEAHEQGRNIEYWIERVHPDDRGMVQELLENNLKGLTDIYNTEYRIQDHDGSWIWLRIRAKTSYDVQGKAVRLDGICSNITAEKELSLELIKSRQLLRTIIDNIPVRIFWKDTNGVYLGYNKLFAHDIDGSTNYDYVGKTDYEFPWKDEAQGYIDDDKEVMTTATAKLNFEEQQTRPNGQKEWLSTSKVPLIDDKGNVYGVLGAYYDITEHKNHQLENEKITRRLETAQELSHMGSWEWDMLTGDLVWSDEVYRIFGEEPQSFPATYEAFVSYIPQEYQEGLQLAIDKAMQSKEPYEYDHEVRRKDGTIRLVREAGYVRFNQKGEPISMLGTVMDINSIVLAETAMRENAELSRRLEKFDENIIASNTDTKGIITYASKAFAKISGYSVEELVGSPQNIVRHEDTPSKVFQKMWETIQSGETWQGNIKNKKKDDGIYWVHTTISPIFNQSKEIIGYSSVRTDITHEMQVQELHQSLEIKSVELQKLNEELEKRVEDAVLQSKEKDHVMAQQSKLASMGEMIGNIAHQWRQPLNALSLLLQKQQVFYERGLLTAEKIQESTEKGTKLINKMSTTIDDFRDFFKPNRKKEYFDVKHAVKNSLELIDAALYDKSIDLTVDISEGNKIYGYESEFSQVILNIVNNAKDALVENNIKGARIKIDAQTNYGFINISISDNAGGIPEGTIDKVFEPYFTTKEEGKGTGIGLYMSKMIIEGNMGGKIQVENLEDGACFTITFDLSKTENKTQEEVL
jgi:PAS domain S-box-containing protein